MKKILLYVFLIVIQLRPSIVWGKIIPTFQGLENSYLWEITQIDSTDYQRPTENQTQYIRQSLSGKLSNGIYITVGTDRGFQAASFFPNEISGLLLVDASEKVVLFNRINIALLQMSSSLGDYQFLRKSASFDIWESRKSKISNHLKDVIKSDYYNWWMSDVEEGYFDGFFSGEKKDEYDLGFVPNFSMIYYGDSNYFNDEKQFLVIKKLADKDLIQSEVVNLNSADAVSELIESIKSSNHSVSVIDLSNLWQRSYMFKNVTKTIMSFNEIANDKTLILNTGNLGFQMRLVAKYELSYFYFVFKYSDLRKLQNPKDRINSFIEKYSSTSAVEELLILNSTIISL